MRRDREKVAIYEPGRDAWNRPCSHSPRRGAALPTPGPQIGSLQNGEAVRFCVGSPPAGGTLLRLPSEQTQRRRATLRTRLTLKHCSLLIRIHIQPCIWSGNPAEEAGLFCVAQGQINHH